MFPKSACIVSFWHNVLRQCRTGAYVKQIAGSSSHSHSHSLCTHMKDWPPSMCWGHWKRAAAVCSQCLCAVCVVECDTTQNSCMTLGQIGCWSELVKVAGPTTCSAWIRSSGQRRSGRSSQVVRTQSDPWQTCSMQRADFLPLTWIHRTVPIMYPHSSPNSLALKLYMPYTVTTKVHTPQSTAAHSLAP